MRSLFHSIAMFCLLVAAVGCNQSGDPVAGTDNGSSNGNEITIGYSAMELTNPFFKLIADTMTDEAAQHGYEVIVLSGDRDVKRQSDQVDEFIVKGVDAIVLNPCDPHSIGPAIKKANEAGIPVFTNDLAYAGGGAEVVSHVATWGEAIGRIGYTHCLATRGSLELRLEDSSHTVRPQPAGVTALLGAPMNIVELTNRCAAINVRKV